MPMRTLPKACVASAAMAGSLLLAPAAYASPGISGDNGTVKIHDSKTGEDLKKNEPHVCTFYLDAFNFDSAQKAWWKIVEWAPTGTKDKVVKAGDTDLDAVGHRRTEDLTLPDGHYRLYWNFEGEHGKAKHKMFWVKCQDAGTPGPSDSPGSTATPTASATPSATSSAGDNGGVQPTGSASPSGAAGGDTSGTGGDSGGNLAETGASVGGIAFAGALLLAAGGALFMRRRKSV